MLHNADRLSNWISIAATRLVVREGRRDHPRVCGVLSELRAQAPGPAGCPPPARRRARPWCARRAEAHPLRDSSCRRILRGRPAHWCVARRPWMGWPRRQKLSRHW